MSAGAQAPGERKTRRAITKLLKTEGPIDSAQLAQRLGLTAMAVTPEAWASAGSRAAFGRFPASDTFQNLSCLQLGTERSTAHCMSD